jgi:hypothetical protein
MLDDTTKSKAHDGKFLRGLFIGAVASLALGLLPWQEYPIVRKKERGGDALAKRVAEQGEALRALRANHEAFKTNMGDVTHRLAQSLLGMAEDIREIKDVNVYLQRKLHSASSAWPPSTPAGAY